MPNIRPINPELAKMAKEELNEVPDRIDEDLSAIRTWLSKQPHIITRTDDQYLVMWLRGTKYSLERTKEKLDFSHTLRTMLTEVFDNCDPTDDRLLGIVRKGNLLPLPLTDGPDGPRIILVRAGVYNANEYTLYDIVKAQSMISEVLIMEDDNSIIAGQVMILDMMNVTMAHFLQWTSPFMKKLMILAQDGTPLRQKGIHFINTPPGFETVYNLFKGFLNEKNRRRLLVHGSDMESLYEHIPKRLLPREYGGEAGPIQSLIVQWEKKIIANKDYLLESYKCGVDEKKRQGTCKTSETLFGISGSFRKLNFD